MNSSPFFIVGSGRSGSTLLRMILASHSRLVIPPETWYLLRLREQLDADRPLSSDEVHYVTRTMINHYRWPDMKLDAGEFQREVAELKSPFLRDVVEVVYRAHVKRAGKVRWGDKTPGYIEIVPQLANLFPGAQFIHLFRDGRDVAKSFQAQGWYGRWLHQNTHAWNEAVDYNERWRHSSLANRLLQVRYEDLVLDTEKTVRNICSFLDEQFEPQMLSWQENVDRLVPAREAHIHEKLKETPNSANVYRWKYEMTTREILVSEAFMGRHLEALGYERKYQSALWAPIFRLTRWYCQLVLPVITVQMKLIHIVRQHFVDQPKHRCQPGAPD